MEAVVRAVADEDSFALLEVARIEWLKFECRGPAAVMEEFTKWSAPDHVRLHLDHIPVIDEDGMEVDYLPILRQVGGVRGELLDQLDLVGRLHASASDLPRPLRVLPEIRRERRFAQAAYLVLELRDVKDAPLAS